MAILHKNTPIDAAYICEERLMDLLWYAGAIRIHSLLQCGMVKSAETAQLGNVERRPLNEILEHVKIFMGPT